MKVNVKVKVKQMLSGDILNAPFRSPSNAINWIVFVLLDLDGLRMIRQDKRFLGHVGAIKLPVFLNFVMI